MRKSINWGDVVIVVILTQLLGLGWYRLLEDTWVDAMERSASNDYGVGVLVVVSVVAGFLLFVLLAHVLSEVRAYSAAAGALWAAKLGLLGVVPVHLMHNLFEQISWVATLIEAGGDLLGLVAGGALLGHWLGKQRVEG